jgi:hypothetical protein
LAAESGTEDLPSHEDNAHNQDLGGGWNDDAMDVDQGMYGRSSGSSDAGSGGNQDMDDKDAMESNRKAPSEDASEPGSDPVGDDRSTDEDTDIDEAELDGVEPEDLSRIFEERFGDEWQQQLHDIRKYLQSMLMESMLKYMGWPRWRRIY